MSWPYISIKSYTLRVCLERLVKLYKACQNFIWLVTWISQLMHTQHMWVFSPNVCAQNGLAIAKLMPYMHIGWSFI